MKKHFSIFLCLSVLAASLAGCGGDGTEQPASGTQSDTRPKETEPLETEIPNPLPEIDFGAAEYRILTAAEQWQDDYVAENDGDAINDVVYQRNRDVEDRYNIKLIYQVFNGWNAGLNDVTTALTGSVMGGTAEFDLMVGSVSYVAPRALENVFMNLYDCKELDLSQPWWYQSINDEMELCGKLFIGAGSLGLATMDGAVITYFNKQLVQDYDLGNLYQTVLDGQWTLDKMMELSKSVTQDLNGDGKYSREDRVGILSSEDYLAFMVNAMGHTYTRRDADGIIEIPDPDDRFFAICDKYENLITDDSYINVYPDFLDGSQDANVMNANMLKMFASNQALFIYHKLLHVTSDVLRNMEPYGLLPSPKFDETQEQYITPVVNDIAAIPGVVKDTALSATVLEALQYYTYRDVRPVYYDIALTRKGTRDEDSEAMLNLIFENPVCDFAYMYSDIIGNLFYGINGNSAKYASFAKSQYKQFRNKLEKINSTVEAFES